MPEQDDGGDGSDPFDGLPDAPPEVTELLGQAIEGMIRQIPLGQACPECGSLYTKHVSIGSPDGDSYKADGWTVVLPPGVFLAYCECSACFHTWEAERA